MAPCPQTRWKGRGGRLFHPGAQSLGLGAHGRDSQACASSPAYAWPARNIQLGGDGVLEGAFRQAGYRNIETHMLSAPLRMASAVECIQFERESFGAFNQMMAHLPHEERESIWDEAEVAMREFEGLTVSRCLASP